MNDQLKLLRYIMLCMTTAILLFGSITLSLLYKTNRLVLQDANNRAAEALARAEFDMTDYINTHNIEVFDAVEGEPVEMVVARHTYADFPGAYEVKIRTVDGGILVCSSGVVRHNYQALDAMGKPVRLPDPLFLDWWAFGGGCTDTLEKGLSVGKYVVETCHAHREPPGFPPGEWYWHCWELNPTFSVWPAS